MPATSMATTSLTTFPSSMEGTASVVRDSMRLADGLNARVGRVRGPPKGQDDIFARTEAQRGFRFYEDVLDDFESVGVKSSTRFRTVSTRGDTNSSAGCKGKSAAF